MSFRKQISKFIYPMLISTAQMLLKFIVEMHAPFIIDVTILQLTSHGTIIYTKDLC